MIAAADAASVARTTLRLLFGRGTRSVIDFLEQIVVLSNLCVLRIELQRLLVRLPGLLELPFMLVGHSEVVVGLGVAGIDFDCTFPPINGLAPQPASRHFD